MQTTQQSETLEFFNNHADQWNEKSKSSEIVNVIRQRNNFVLDTIDKRKSTNKTLDVGCGTGNLVIEIAQRNIHATGIDFAKEMIETAQSNAAERKTSNANFNTISLFDLNPPNNQFDLISANGFIEYISYNELEQFLNIAYKTLTPGGSLVLGSRNRLFNIFSLNSFTEDEINNGSAVSLLKEAHMLASATDINEISQAEAIPIQFADKTHKHTGIGVSTRFQYTPLQLMSLTKKYGFTVQEIYPVHYHGVPATFKESHPEIHIPIANKLCDFGHENISLIPFSSSFMIHVQK